LGSPDPSRTATIAARRGPGRIWVVTRSAQLQSGVSRLLPEYRKLFCQRTFASTDSGVDTANSASHGDTAPRNHLSSASHGDTAPRNHLSVSKSHKINQISTITPSGHQTRSECCVPGSYRELHRQRGPTPDGSRRAAFTECIARGHSTMQSSQRQQVPQNQPNQHNRPKRTTNVIGVHRGRDGCFQPPPAQIRT